MTGTQQGDQRIPAALLAVFAALAVVIAMIPFASPAAAQTNGDDAEVEVTRFAGAQRYETARLIAADAWETSDTVVIAKAETWPDALAGNYVAGLYDSPVLLVSRLAVQGDTLAALDDLGAENLIVLGGEGAISEDNVTAFRDAGYEVDRVFGETRYETAAEITTRFVDEQGDYIVGTWDEQRTAIVATGQEFADALVSGPAAFAGQFPLLLTPRATLHPAADAALDELDIERVILPGGTAAVTDEVEAAIADKGIEVTRVAGADGTGRWGTATAFADFLIDNLGFTAEAVDIATGFDFPDALTMGPHAGRLGAPLLLTNGTQDVPVAPVTDWLSDTACESAELHIAGGFGAVSETNEAALVAAANACGTEPVIVDPEQSGVTTDEAANTTVTVTVVDTDGAPVTGLTAGDISYTDPGGTTNTLAGWEYWLDFTEDEPGVYTATIDPQVVPEGEYTTTDWAVGDIVIEETVVVFSAGTAPDVEVDPAASGVAAEGEDNTTVTVTVLDTGGEPVTGLGAADISYLDADGAADSLAADYWQGFTEDQTTPGVYTATVNPEALPAGDHTTTDWTVGGVVIEETVVISSAGPAPDAQVDPAASGVTADGENTTVTVTVVDTDGAPVTGLSAAAISYLDADGVADSLAAGYWLGFTEVAATPGVYTATVNPEGVPAGDYTTTNWTVSGVVIEETVVVSSTGPAADTMTFAGNVTASDATSVTFELVSDVVDPRTGETHQAGDIITRDFQVDDQYFVVDIDPSTGERTNRQVDLAGFQSEIVVGYALAVVVDLDTDDAIFYLAESFPEDTNVGSGGLSAAELDEAFGIER